MSTRLSARNIFPPLDNLKLTIRRRSRVDPTLLNDFEMAAEGPGDLPVPDLRTMEELCQPSLNGRGGPIAPISIQATNFGLKNDMIQQVQNSCQFHGLPVDDANKHLDKFLHHATAWFDRLPRNSINPFEQMAKFFLDTLAQRSESSSSITSSFDTKITALKDEIVKINKNLMRVLQVNQQVKAVTPRCETWGGPHSFSDCPATVGNTQNVYVVGAYQESELLEPKQESRKLSSSEEQPREKTIPQPQVVTTNEFTNFMKANDAILKNMQTNMNYLTNSNLEFKNMFGQFMKMNTASSSGSGTLPGYIITNLKEELKGISTRSGTAYQGPTIPTTFSSLPPVVERETEVTKDMVHPTNNGSTKDVQPSVFQTESPFLNFEQLLLPSLSPLLLHFADALILVPKFGPSIKSLLTNKEKLFELARTPLNELCLAVLLKKLLEKLGDLGKFLIPCNFPRMVECLALANLDASINLMPLSVWNKLSLPELTPTLMTLELADQSISRPIGVAEDVYVKVGKFHFLADFVVIDFDADPRVPLILRRSFLKIGRALIDVFEGKLTLRVGKEAITFNLDQTSRYSANYNDMTANRIDIIDMACFNTPKFQRSGIYNLGVNS
uniref:Reverse transcriptase domain-containing protein n=1 Tax=Tanacetum cinerariifolium TaxID=118510 RepID=A0A699HR20_TANCI|nr:reverse transcriptase domain-containing protein [Tanacetum cinerariifolium]